MACRPKRDAKGKRRLVCCNRGQGGYSPGPRQNTVEGPVARPPFFIQGDYPMFSTPAFADAATAAQQPGLIESFLPLILIVVIFWFLVLRPQSKRMKQHREMVANVKRGDTVVTAGGLIGKVVRVKDDNEIEVEIGEGVKVRVVKSTLSEVRAKGEPAKTEE